MADIPQEVREAAADFHHVNGVGPLQSRRIVADEMRRGEHDEDPLVKALHAMFLAGKRAGMERAAEIIETIRPRPIAYEAVAAVIRSENDGHG